MNHSDIVPANHATPRLRVGSFDKVESAQRAITLLLDAGFLRDRISVITSNKSALLRFPGVEQTEPAGSHTKEAATAGAAIGALLGGATLMATVATGGLALLVAGGLAAWTGGVVGGLVGAMMTRGIEPELANFYDQEVANGKILVAVETEGTDQTADLAKADQIFELVGAGSINLRKG